MRDAYAEDFSKCMGWSLGLGILSNSQPEKVLTNQPMHCSGLPYMHCCGLHNLSNVLKAETLYGTKTTKSIWDLGYNWVWT